MFFAGMLMILGGAAMVAVQVCAWLFETPVNWWMVVLGALLIVLGMFVTRED